MAAVLQEGGTDRGKAFSCSGDRTAQLVDTELSEGKKTKEGLFQVVERLNSMLLNMGSREGGQTRHASFLTEPSVLLTLSSAHDL